MTLIDNTGEGDDLSSFRDGRTVHAAAGTDAERYLVLGKALVRVRCRGRSPELFCRALRMSESDCRAAVEFADASPATILRALVEEWTWPQIQQVLQKEAKEKPHEHIA